MSDSNDPGRNETETSLPRSPDRQKAAKMALYHKICTVVGETYVIYYDPLDPSVVRGE